MKSADPDVDIRYTLNGAEPDVKSHLYAGPITLKTTTMVKARTFRKGIARIPPTVSDDKVSAVECAVYTKSKPREAVPATGAAPGLACSYYEENPWQLSGYIVDVISPLKHIAVKELFDISAKGTNGVYAFAYNGYIDIPRDGVYSFHAPREFVFPSTDCGYDLRVFLGRDEWYPATRWHNFGAWSVALKKGKHPFRVVWVDQRQQDVYVGGSYRPYPVPRRGVFSDRTWEDEKPVLEISGPGLEKQPIPAKWLWH
jgi:hypothetical protein